MSVKPIIRRIILILLFISVVNIAESQYSLDIRTTQKINLESLKLVEKYQFLYDMRKGRDYDNFIDAFVSSQTMIFNDIMPDNALNEMVTIDDYLNLFDTYYRNPINVNIIPFELSEIRPQNTSEGELSINCYKIMSGNTKAQINYIDTFIVEIVIYYNLKKNAYKIKTVNLKSPNNGQYFVIEANLRNILGKDRILKNDTLIINGKPVGLDDKGFCIIKNLNDTNSFDIESPNDDIVGVKTINKNSIDIYPNSENGDKNTRKLYFKQPYFYAEFNIAKNPCHFNTIKHIGKQQISFGKNNKSYDIGFNIGMLISPKHRVYLEVGGHFKRLNYVINMDEYIYTTNETDPDNYNYLRTNDIRNITEELSIQYIALPLGIYKIFKLKYFQINSELGAIWHYSLSAKSTSHADAKYSGYYQYLYGIEISENGVYDFGSYKLQNQRKLLPTKSFFSTYALLGVGYYLNKRTSVNLDYIYNFGFNYIFEENVLELSGTKEELNSITNISNEFILREIYFDINLKYKF